MKKKISLHEDNLFLAVYLYLLDVFQPFKKAGLVFFSMVFSNLFYIRS
ncbi:hypothetical protein [Prevotella denticola]|jgi:hypothetical protein|nr:hypothetical protein [Prevotella denticola]QUB91082.1 hypothetical protein J4855_00945 [Prevotella denticola]